MTALQNNLDGATPATASGVFGDTEGKGGSTGAGGDSLSEAKADANGTGEHAQAEAEAEDGARTGEAVGAVNSNFSSPNSFLYMLYDFNDTSGAIHFVHHQHH